MIYTCIQGRNDDLIAQVAQLYLKNNNHVLDLTYGKGIFWKKINKESIRLETNDIDENIDVDTHCDCRNMDADPNSFDVVVLDLPYVHNPGKMFVDDTYNNAATTKGLYHKDIIAMYEGGMKEAYRILVKGGYLWVKIQDEIESSKQKWSHIELYNIGNQIGFYAKDLFVLHQLGKPHVQHKKQYHARKNHSYLWVLQK